MLRVSAARLYSLARSTAQYQYFKFLKAVITSATALQKSASGVTAGVSQNQPILHYEMVKNILEGATVADATITTQEHQAMMRASAAQHLLTAEIHRRGLVNASILASNTVERARKQALAAMAIFKFIDDVKIIPDALSTSQGLSNAQSLPFATVTPATPLTAETPLADFATRAYRNAEALLAANPLPATSPRLATNTIIATTPSLAKAISFATDFSFTIFNSFATVTSLAYEHPTYCNPFFCYKVPSNCVDKTYRQKSGNPPLRLSRICSMSCADPDRVISGVAVKGPKEHKADVQLPNEELQHLVNFSEACSERFTG